MMRGRCWIGWKRTHKVELPYDLTGGNGMQIVGPTTKEDMAELARQFGECEKEFVDDSFYLRKRFGTVTIFGFTARKEVCERVVVGTEDVPERITPAYTKELVEWKCTSLLNGEGD